MNKDGVWEPDTQIVQLYKQQSAIFMGEDNSMNALHLNYFIFIMYSFYALVISFYIMGY